MLGTHVLAAQAALSDLPIPAGEMTRRELLAVAKSGGAALSAAPARAIEGGTRLANLAT